jgi:hypothetical protein
MMIALTMIYRSCLLLEPAKNNRLRHVEQHHPKWGERRTDCNTEDEFHEDTPLNTAEAATLFTRR